MITDQETETDLETFLAPWGKSINLKSVVYDSGLEMLRVTIREKKRFTMLDLDTGTARHLAQRLVEWAERADEAMSKLPPAPPPDEAGGEHG
ncbi:MAG: hypothetical protein HQL33_07200 [Alphaproteobacteria bacterium]|nr:hypothetical protein [Alphaproteobacteria bacterium]